MNQYRLFLYIVFLGLYLNVSGQKVLSDSIYISVTPVDGVTDYPLRNAKVTITDSIGHVLCDSLAMNIREASYRETYERVSYVGTITRLKCYNVCISAPGYDKDTITVRSSDVPDLYLGNVYMRHASPKGNLLREVTVTATKVKMVMKGDTLEYDATAFQLPEGSMLDALIATLPGATLNDDGQITVNGQFVSELLINGRKFFNGDPQIALRNLPSYTVKNVQVYRKTLDQYAGMNIERDRSQDPLVMDVNLKREYMGGWIANAEGGAGSALGHGWDTRWMGRLFAMRYDKFSYFAMHASANNLNDPQKAGRKGQWSKPRTLAGETTTKRAGLEFNTDWHDQTGNGLNTTVDVIRQTSLNSNSELAEQYITGGNTFSRLRSSNDRGTWQLNWRGEISRIFGDICRIWFSTDVGYDKGTEKRFSESAKSNSMLPENFTAPGSDDWHRDILYQRQQLWNIRDNKFTTNWKMYFHLYCVHYHILGINANGNYDNIKTDSDNSDHVIYPNEPARDFMLQQRDNSPSRNWQYTINPYWNTSYSISDKKFKMRASATYTYTQKFNYGRRELEETDDNATPSMAGSWMLDEANSYRTTRREWRHNLEAGIDLYFNRLHINLNGNGIYDIRHLNDFRDHTTRLLNRQDWAYDGHLGLEIGDQWNSGYGIRFGYREQLPDIMQMLDVRDNSDPLRISLGNADLHKSNDYNISAYVTNRFGSRQTYYSFEVQYRRTDNAIAMARTYDRTTGVTIWQPQNINGNWQLYGNFHYDSYIDRQKRLNLSNDFIPKLRHSVDFSSDSDTPQRVAVDGWTIFDNLQLNYTFSFPLKLSAKAEFSWTHMHSCNNLFSNFSYTDVNYGIGVQYTLPWNIDLDTDLMAYCRRGYEDPTMNTTDWVWNLQLSKAFGRSKQWVVKAIGLDLLQQLPTIKQVINPQGRTETRLNSRPAYALLTLTYRLDIKPRKK